MKPILLCLLLFCSGNVFSQSTATTDSVIDPHQFNSLEKEAEYPGGVEAWRKYLQKNLNPNTPVDNGAPVGRYEVIAKFIVNKDGSISSITCETKLGYGLEAEVIRILRESGKWVPAEQLGKAVNAYRRQPITFVVQQDNFKVTTTTPNTLYTRTKNRIHVAVVKGKNAKLEVTTSAGTITDLGDGDYLVELSKPGRVILSITRNGKDVGEESFMVLDN